MVSPEGSFRDWQPAVRMAGNWTESIKLCLSQRAWVQVVKNKVGSPGKVGEYDFMFASGVNTQGCLLDVAETLGMASKRVSGPCPCQACVFACVGIRELGQSRSWFGWQSE